MTGYVTLIDEAVKELLLSARALRERINAIDLEALEADARRLERAMTWVRRELPKAQQEKNEA